MEQAHSKLGSKGWWYLIITQVCIYINKGKVWLLYRFSHCTGSKLHVCPIKYWLLLPVFNQPTVTHSSQELKLRSCSSFLQLTAPNNLKVTVLCKNIITLIQFNLHCICILFVELPVEESKCELLYSLFKLITTSI